MILGLIQPSAGDIRVEAGAPCRSLRARGPVSQADPDRLPEPRLVAESAAHRGRPAGGAAEIHRPAAAPAAADGGAAGDGRSAGGLCQHVPARAVGRAEAARGHRPRARRPSRGMLVLDEPTSALDVWCRSTVIALLHRLRTEFGLTYLFISHDLSPDAQFLLAHRRDAARRGGGGRRPAEVFAAPSHPYTRALIAAIPVDHRGGGAAEARRLGGGERASGSGFERGLTGGLTCCDWASTSAAPIPTRW
jgi:peptide/nickel transport system ATP-binding protein